MNRRTIEARHGHRTRLVGPLVGAGLVLGIGIGGFVDGILLRQILQWHNLLSSVAPSTDLVALQYNMAWDRLFHALTWTMCVIGIFLLFRAGHHRDEPWSGRLLLGTMLAGWGLFNLIEGLMDHQLLPLHHVHPGRGRLAWDVGFVLIGGLGLMLIGYLVGRPRALRDGLGDDAEPIARAPLS